VAQTGCTGDLPDNCSIAWRIENNFATVSLPNGADMVRFQHCDGGFFNPFNESLFPYSLCLSTCPTNVSNGGSISANQSGSGSFNPARLNGNNLGSGVYYQWQFRNGTSGTFVNISGATGEDYDPPTVTSTRQFRRLARRATCNPFQVSNIVTVTVNPRPNVNAGANQTICRGNSTTISASASGGTPGYTFTWNQGLGTGATKTVSPTSTTDYTVTVRDARGCTDNDVVRVNVVVNVPNGGTISGNQTNCGSFDPANITGNNLGSGVVYQWQFRNGTSGNFVNIANANGLSFNPGPISNTRQYRRLARRLGGCPFVASNIVTKTVTSDITKIVLQVNNSEVCAGEGTQLRATVTRGSGLNYNVSFG
jgi:hypothetical protein